MAYVRTRLGRWFFVEHGAARHERDACIVLLHGLLFDGGMWDACVRPLAELGRVVVLDGPGHGKSEVPPPFTLEDHAEALLDVFRELRVPRAVLVGLSWGGMLAMRVAIAHPTHVAAMALLDTSADAEQFFSAFKYSLMAALTRRFGLPASMFEKEIAPLLFGGKTLQDRPELVAEAGRRINGFSREGLARAARAVSIRRKSILTKLPAVEVPTLVMCGRDDRATLPKHSEAIASRIKGARLVWIEESGHMSAIEQPEAVNATLVPFVREQLRARPA
jgi:3-oxoadipate enol-lactonase